ncbi:SAC3/GANP/Nin1/mts3/eIF-3 p25 family-domain-containing protein [Phellopilus nigrolimitatus]|nr:SAC3/GANP/Nin1/mts3/eIF-3 p25 family-domain-containing protein [Phellopilus nigrolimitatus]
MSDASTQLQNPTPHRARQFLRGSGGRGGTSHVHSKNKTWVSGQSSSSAPSEAKWERGRGGGVPRSHARGAHTVNGRGGHSNVPSTNVTEDEDEPEADTAPFSVRFASSVPVASPSNVGTKTWEELVKTREIERARAIREGKMDDPTKPKRLDEAITIVGTCQDMCPEFERYRRERENNLDKWECLMGPDGKPTKKVDHAHAVKIYERGQGDKIIPSDLRPPLVLKNTLNYLFHDLITRGGFAETQAFVRDRSRAVRNDFTIQQDTGPIAMECHERCTRFHILSLHLMYGLKTFDRSLEIQQLMNSLLSLKEFYDDQRGKYQSPHELEMRIYHRLGLIRDQHERNDKAPIHIASDPAFQLITRFRSEVQAASSPITKTSKMKVSAAAMQTFAELAGVLRERRNIIMIYLIACFLEHIFGKDTIDDMESIKGPLTIQDIIDGNSEVEGGLGSEVELNDSDAAMGDFTQNEEGESGEDELGAFVDDVEYAEEVDEGASEDQHMDSTLASPLKRGATQWLTDNFGVAPTPPKDAISHSSSAPGSTSTSPFGGPTTQSAFATPRESGLGKLTSSATTPSTSIFGTALSVFGTSKNVFGGPVFGAPSTNKLFSTAATGEPTTQPAPSTTQPAISNGFKSMKGSFGSLGNAPPLGSEGEEDRVPISEAVKTPHAPPPFASSESAPALNSSALGFAPSTDQPSRTSISPAGPRASLTPLRTDTLLQNIVDPNRRSFLTPSGSSFPLHSPEKAVNGSTLSINTGVTLKSSGQSRKAFAIDSPVGPPPLNRKAPISLPGTPTATFPDTASPVGPSTPLTAYDFSKPRVSTSTTTTSLADTYPSPTPISSFGTPEQNSALLHRQPSSSFPSPLGGVRSTNTKGSLLSSAAIGKEKTEAELQSDAKEFVWKRLVFRLFLKWKQRAINARAWKEACQRSDAYKKKLHESASGNLSQSSSSSKRQREVYDTADEPGRARRRLKCRVSHGTATRTDEELAERLAQNKKENERIWAKGSFVKAIQTDLQKRQGHRHVPPNWTTWLCMNPDNDRTAIWLQEKFDVPNSGNWESEAIFSIPISANPSLEGFPGLIVFECTPLEGVKDEFERKYRILDDCARLRDIIAMLPDRRHYSPAILFVNWDSKLANDIVPDISEMVASYISETIVRDTTTLISSNDLDLDQSFVNCLTKLSVDLRGELVERLTLKNVFEYLISPWREAAFVWLDACASDDIFNWAMFSHVLEYFVENLNAMMKIVMATWSPSSSQVTPFPQLPFGRHHDERSVSQSVRDWLRSPMFDANYLTSSYSSADFNKDFEAHAFFDHLLDLAVLHVEQSTSGSMLQRAITKVGLERAVSDFDKILEESQLRLRVTIKTLPRLSLRRNSDGFPPQVTDVNESVSQTASPVPSTPINGAKYTRVPPSKEVPATEPSEPSSPTPSATPSAADSSTSLVTVAMLRALARDVLKTHGGKSPVAN